FAGRLRSGRGRSAAGAGVARPGVQRLRDRCDRPALSGDRRPLPYALQRSRSAIPGDPRRPGSLAIGVVRRAAVSGERCARSAGSAATPARASLPARAESGRAAGRRAEGVRRSLLPGSAVQGAGNILLTAERLPGTPAQAGRTAGRSGDTAWTRAQLG